MFRFQSWIHRAIYLLPLFLLLLIAPSAHAQVQITLLEPQPNAVVTDTVTVQASLNSTYEPKNFTARVMDREAPFIYSQTTNRWTAAVNLEGLIRGAYTVQVQVEDARGNTASAQVSIVKEDPPQSDIRIDISSPVLSKIPAQTLDLTVPIRSAYAIRSVTAEFNGQSIDLKAFIGPPVGYNWMGSFSVAGLPIGNYPLTIRAEDVKGFLKTVQVTVFRYEQEPLTIRAFSPQMGDVAFSQLRLQASCIGDGPQACVSLQAVLGSDIIAGCTPDDPTCVDENGVLRMDKLVDISRYPRTPGQAGDPWTVVFVGRTASGAWTESSAIYIHLEKGEGWQLEAKVPGIIMDFQPDRILYKKYDNPKEPFNSNLESGYYDIFIRDRATGKDTFVAAGNGAESYGLLTPRGAHVIYNRGIQAGILPRLLEFRDGSAKIIGGADIQIERNFAAWTAGRGVVQLYNVQTDEVTSISSSDPNRTPGAVLDVSPSGEVVFQHSTNSEAFLWRAGEIRHSFSIPQKTNSFIPKVQVAGGRVAYQEVSSGPVRLLDDNGNLIFSSDLLSGSGTTFLLDESGWLAYIQRNQNGLSQAYLRSPGGETRQMSFFNSGVYYLCGLSSNGELAYRADKSYLTGWGWGTERELGTRCAQSSDGKWYVVVNGSVFSVANGGVFKRGDVNGDGDVDVSDVILALQSSVQSIQLTSPQFTAADVDGSGDVDVADAVKILRVIVQFDPPFSN